jgi:DNA repair exonuclease SbcCD ATPase subunit
MKIAYVDLAGFRGYRNRLRLEFGDAFTIIDGRNGVGKSTIFDAIEFVLTGTVSKYDSAKASGESIEDYLWWTGDGPAPSARYVEVGFRDDDQIVSLKRAQFDEPDAEQVQRITAGLVDQSLVPSKAPLQQLCATAIIRDEHIASLSLDLKETDRYALLRDALGANDAEAWIKRGADLVAAAKKRTSAAQIDVTATNVDIGVGARRVDEIRANLIAESAIAEASARLRQFADTVAPPDRLSGPVRRRIADLTPRITSLVQLASQAELIEADRERLNSLEEAVRLATARQVAAQAELEGIEPSETTTSSALAEAAKNIVDLVALGRRIGLQDGQCPLCAKGQSHDEFVHGIGTAEALARRLDEAAAREAEREQRRKAAEQELAAAASLLATESATRAATVARIAAFEEARRASNVGDDATGSTIRKQADHLRETLDQAQRDLRVLDTLRFNSELERSQQNLSELNTRLLRAQDRLGRAQKAEAIAQAFHDAARRAAAETLDIRLERVLPLMSELYQRLRPHPIWKDIEYSIRGDVRRFLKLQVGENLNPQFLFSSGQRRATGLAFLLSINISLAWSRWQSILLDDPVQHIDDFRAVHLAEVAAQLVSEGRQIVCAVEDSALADMLCRRLPVATLGQAKRITLGVDEQGALAKLNEKSLAPFVQRALVSVAGQSAAS